MPGQLKADAVCPRCGDPLLALVDTTVRRGVRAGNVPGLTLTREYFHGKVGPKTRRRRRCVYRFEEYQNAVVERRRLEVAIKK